ncbi:hypothetical protein HNQ07_002835 [Deinococcus metalli]|uniref:Uncharacterized protein n=1 Tax=Deinococcus metalli TaxID=1141878 RepID=A0A7W8NRW9_9DEIO|nr:hypothetical protein [Deinococcus metalli]MBB5377343.1 hypothetical protein [Deinococcus metalli]GHF49764.1 hypothetical protein GCM10017781_27700 [Deinococcus metalli]
MDFQTFEHQVRLAAFPPGVRVSAHPEGAGWTLRAASEDGRAGLNLLLTDGAADMYGEGPAFSAALARLRQAAVAGLPPVRPDGTLDQLVFVRD